MTDLGRTIGDRALPPRDAAAASPATTPVEDRHAAAAAGDGASCIGHPPRPTGASADLAELTGPFYDEAGVLQWLGSTPEALAAATADHRILAATSATGQVLIPAWQFHTDGTTIPHLQEVLTILSRGIEDPWTWALWMTAPDDSLGGMCSAHWLAAGNDAEPVLNEAARDAARWRQ